MNDLLWTTARQSLSVLILLDLSAAFDTVDHQVFLNILQENLGSRIAHYKGSNHTCKTEVLEFVSMIHIQQGGI